MKYLHLKKTFFITAMMLFVACGNNTTQNAQQPTAQMPAPTPAPAAKAQPAAKAPAPTPAPTNTRPTTQPPKNTTPVAQPQTKAPAPTPAPTNTRPTTRRPNTTPPPPAQPAPVIQAYERREHPSFITINKICNTFNHRPTHQVF